MESIQTNTIDNYTNVNVIATTSKPKRKYKKRHNVNKETVETTIDTTVTNDIKNNELNLLKIPKKRGRKPKGGKLVKNEPNDKNTKQIGKENVIIHLKCSVDDLKENMFSDVINYNPNVETVATTEDDESGVTM